MCFSVTRFGWFRLICDSSLISDDCGFAGALNGVLECTSKAVDHRKQKRLELHPSTSTLTTGVHIAILFAMSAPARPDSTLFVNIFGHFRIALIVCTDVQGAVPPSVMSLLGMGADSGARPQLSDELGEMGKVSPIPESLTRGKRKRADLEGETVDSETPVDSCTVHSSTCTVVVTAEGPAELTQDDDDESIFVTWAELRQAVPMT